MTMPRRRSRESILRFSGVTVVCHAAATEPEKQCGETARERANQVAVSHHSRIRCGAEDIIDLADQRRADTVSREIYSADKNRDPEAAQMRAGNIMNVGHGWSDPE